MTNPNDYDPLADSEKSPAMSFKDQPVGTVHTVDVGEPGKFIQQRDFDTDEPAVWDDGNPKMAAVFNGTGIDGEPLSLWAPKPSDLFSKLAGAQKALGRRIGMSDQIDRIHVKLADRVPAKNPKYTKSIYAVKIEPVGAKPKSVEADPFADDQPPF